MCFFPFVSFSLLFGNKILTHIFHSLTKGKLNETHISSKMNRDDQMMANVEHILRYRLGTLFGQIAQISQSF